MVRVIAGEYRPQDAHYGFYRDDLPSGDVILIRRKVGEPTDYLHPNSRKVRQQRLNFGLASTHYSHLTPIQKRELRYVVEEVSFVRGHSKSDTKVLQGRTLFISKDIHSLNELQKHIPSYLQICIALADQDLNLIDGDIWLYGLIDGEWREEDRRQLSPSHWLFPTVPRDLPLYHPVGAAEGYYDPQDPDTTYLTLKQLMLYHYHPLTLRPVLPTEILRPNASGDLCEIDSEQGEPCPNHWMNVDEEIADDDETYVTTLWGNIFKSDLYKLQTPIAAVRDITKVTIYHRLKKWGSYTKATYGHNILKTHDQIFAHAYPLTHGVWYTDTWVLEKNPATNEPWTFEELNDLQVGISIGCWDGWEKHVLIRCSQIYAEAEYYAPQ